ncbi:MAG: DUF6600 domain-containing protein, partial [Terriglobia bacterium]
VRLSFVDGTVLVKRPGMQTWAKASVNTPIEQGFSVSTSANSFAEVQFENGSTARLGQLSRLDFTELALTPKGDKINRLHFAQGYGTFHLTPQHGDVYSVAAANSVITPRGKSEFRTDFTQERLRVQVFNGSVDVKSPKQSTKLTKNKTLQYDPEMLSAFDVSHGVQKDSWDRWVGKRDSQAELAYNDSPVGTNSSLYGWNDLDEYGEWGFFPGYGYGWAPFTPAGWTPFSAGQWSWYPGWGYTWISSEPWGWLPYHYGYWNYNPGFGYFWTPRNMSSWNPGSVAWYGGPGYVGWAALGAQGTAVCRTAACVTAVRTGTIQNGVPVDRNSRVHVPQANLSHVVAPKVAPTNLAMRPGAPRNPTPLRPAAFSTARRVVAPNIVLMGLPPAQRAAQPGASMHQSFFRRTFEGDSSSQPLRARLGNTLGGRYTAFTRTGTPAFRAVAPGQLTESGRNQRLAGSSALRANPVFLEHRSQSFSQSELRLEGGRIHQVRGPGTEAPRGFEGIRGGTSGTGVARPATPPPSSPASTGTRRN